MNSEQQRTLRQIKSPASIFKLCPDCGSANLFKFEGDVICFHCDWNSAAAGMISWHPKPIPSIEAGIVKQVRQKSLAKGQ